LTSLKFNSKLLIKLENSHFRSPWLLLQLSPPVTVNSDSWPWALHLTYIMSGWTNTPHRSFSLKVIVQIHRHPHIADKLPKYFPKQKHWDSAYLCQGTSYWCHDTDPDPWPNRYQNLIICSLAHSQPCLKILCKSVRKFLCKVVNRPTNNNNENILLGKGKYVHGAAAPFGRQGLTPAVRCTRKL